MRKIIKGKFFVIEFSLKLFSFLVAICNDTCNHCKKCISPDLCTCETGWTGDDCCTGQLICRWYHNIPTIIVLTVIHVLHKIHVALLIHRYQ